MKEKVMTLRDIVELTANRKCLVCQKDLDKEFGKYRWHIPLCRKHRKIIMSEIFENEKKIRGE